MPESLFKIKLQASACNFIKKETLSQIFSCEFHEISKNIIFTEHLWATASDARQHTEVVTNGTNV